MKKYLSLFTVVLCISGIQAQEITTSDALRYAQDNTNGTARFRAMSGAFGALGGDLSAININPAGSAIFANNQFTVTANNYNTKNKSKYFGTNASENNNSFDFNQAGGVFVFENHKENADWKKFSIAVNYENLNNFDNSLFSAGTNPTSSIDKYFLHYANKNGGISVTNLDLQLGESISDLYSYLGSNFGFDAQQAFLGYQAFVIDPAADYDENTNRNYVSLVPAGGNYYQENAVESTGYNGKLSFNVAAQYQDKLFFGINLNSHFTDYRRSSTFYERNNNNTTTTDLIKRVYFNNDLYTYGTGFSFQLGTIYKISNDVRIGLAYDSPTWLKLNDELIQSVTGVSGSTNGELSPDFVDPQITNIYAPYKLSTPGKWTGSFAYVFGKQGLISIDYSIKDYSATEFRPNNDFRGLNEKMSSELTNANELRIGAEHKIKQWSLRAGYRFEQSPYKNKEVMGNLTGYSGGIGYNFGSTKLDFAYSTAKRDYASQFLSQGMTDSAKINSKTNNITVTLAFEL